MKTLASHIKLTYGVYFGKIEDFSKGGFIAVNNWACLNEIKMTDYTLDNKPSKKYANTGCWHVKMKD